MVVAKDNPTMVAQINESVIAAKGALSAVELRVSGKFTLVYRMRSLF